MAFVGRRKKNTIVKRVIEREVCSEKRKARVQGKEHFPFCLIRHQRSLKGF